MSTLKVTNIEHGSTTDGGIQLDSDGHVTIDGQQLPTSGALSNRNLIINGAMTVAQRGTGNFPIGDDDYPTDRFLFSNSGSGFTGGANGTQSTTAPDGFKNSFEVDVTTADTSLTSDSQGKIEYRVEGNDSAHLDWGTANAQTVTLSFYIRSNVTGESAVAFVNEGNNRSYVATFNIDTADTWERKEITVTGPTDGTWATGTGIGIRLRWGSFGSNFQTTSTNQWLSTQRMTSSSSINFFSSTDNNLFLTGVQLEVGDKATPFEHRNFGEELRKCQRYCQHSFTGAANTGNTTNTGIVLAGGSTTGNSTTFLGPAHIQLSPNMVAAPTVTIFDLASPRNTGKVHRHTYGSAGSNDNTATITDINTKSFVVRSDSGSSGSGIIFHYLAEAEL